MKIEYRTITDHPKFKPAISVIFLPPQPRKRPRKIDDTEVTAPEDNDYMKSYLL